ncbi:MAG: dTDP-glucose 4,6-dehydratase [Muribaculaceae bacterium]
MEPTILVTGGAGFIGVNYVKALVSASPAPRVVVLDALTYAGCLASLSDETASGTVVFVRGDIADSGLVASLLRRERPAYIVNFAAESHVDRSIADPRPFIDTNIVGTQNLLEQARRWRDGQIAAGDEPTLKRFVQISTDEVYGHLAIDRPEGFRLSAELGRSLGRAEAPLAYGTESFSESTPLNPSSPYSASKASADMIALAYARTFAMPVCVTRCSNNYGPYQFPEKLIPLVINNILEGRAIPVYGAGENVRDWLHVDDHVRAIEAVRLGGADGEVYNIGGFNERRNIDIVRRLIDTVRRLVESDARYRDLAAISPEKMDYNLISHVADRAAHDLRYAIDSSKLMERTGWRPEVDFDNGLERTVRWYLDKRGWVKDITDGDYRDYYRRMYGGE